MSTTLDYSPDIKTLIAMGAIYPAPFMAVAITNDRIAAGTTLGFTPGSTAADFNSCTIKYEFKVDYAAGEAAVVSIGADGETDTYLGKNTQGVAIVTGELAKSVLDGIFRGSPTKFFLKIPNQKKTLEVNDALGFKVIYFSKAEAARLSGQGSSGAANMRPGVTENEATPKPFTFENLYLNDEGDITQRNVAAKLTKRANSISRRDNFELEFIDNVALVPIRLKRAVSAAEEATTAAPHWAAAVLGPLPSATSVVAHVPVSKIDWSFEGNYLDYALAGPEGGPDIITVDAVGVDPRAVANPPPGVTLVSIEDANREGVASGNFSEPFDNALSDYIRSQQNLVGKAMYTSPRLNGMINSYYQKVFKTF